MHTSCLQSPCRALLCTLLLIQLAISSCFKSSPAPVVAGQVQPPEFCTIGPYVADEGSGAATTMAWGGNMLKVYHNLYRHTNKWFAVVLEEGGGGSNGSNGSNSSSDCRDSSGSNSSAHSSVNASSDDSTGIDAGISLNNQLQFLPVTDSKAFQDNVKVCFVPGVTLLIDFPFPAFPDNLGHWAELLLPTYSVFSNPDWRRQIHNPGKNQFIDRLLLLNVRPEHLYNWPKEVLALSLDPALPQPQQRLLVPWEKSKVTMWGEASISNWTAQGWMVFENLVVVQDRYPIMSLPKQMWPQPPATSAAAPWQDGLSLWRHPLHVGFNHHSLAPWFREAAFARHLWGPPLYQAGGGTGSSSSSSSSLKTLPKVVTVLMYSEDYPPVVNHRALVDLLEAVAQPLGFKVQTVSLTTGAPFLSHMATMAETGLLVARHGPLLASAVLLPPGAAVLELLPYKWEWRSVSRLYYNMTQSTGYLHHWAWRPVDAKWCKYKEASHARYSGFTPSECHGRECLMVHAQAGLEVDLEAVRDLLQVKLRGLLAGKSVDELQEPWPLAE